MNIKITKVLLVVVFFTIQLKYHSQYDTINCNFEIKDTIKYVTNKSNSLLAISMNNNNNSVTPATDDGYNAFGQLFEAPDTVTLDGFCFYAFMYSGSQDSVLSRVYKTNAIGEIDSLIDSSWVEVPLRANYSGDLYSDSIKICVNYDAPIKIKGDYVITLSNNSSSDMYIVRNNNGINEDLSYTYYYLASDNSYNGWYKCFSSFGSSWDFDVLIEPIVSYPLRTQHIISNSNNCLGDTIAISSSIQYKDSLFYNKMYNPNFNSYSPLYSFIYNYGDTIKQDTFHSYVNSGAYNIHMSGLVNLNGWTFNNYTSVCSYGLNILNVNVNLGEDIILCSDSINLNAGSFFESYQWSTSDTSSSITVYADSLPYGIYQYSVKTEYGGCYSYDTINLEISNTMPVNIGNDTVICVNNEQLELYTNITGQHVWNTGQFTDTIIVGPFNTPDSLTYVVEVESNGCIGSDTINIVINHCLGIDGQVNIDITTYPNPAKDIINISNNIWNNYSIFISDLNGKIIKQEKSYTFSKTIGLENISNGIYILTISNGEKNVKQKLQIIK